MKIYKKKANPISYGGKRSKGSVKYIVIHYTGNKGDTAKNNVDFFAAGNKRPAGAHFFVDKSGQIGRSIPMNLTAWAVGGSKYPGTSGGSYYGKCTNSNSVSIELCDLASGAPSQEQMKAVKALVKYIQEYCPNAKTIIRHWDVTGKTCPATMAGKDNKQWKHFHNFLTKGYLFKAKVTEKAAIRSGPEFGDNKIGEKKKGNIVYIKKVVGSWGRLKKDEEKGMPRWISLKKVKEL